MDYLNKLVEYKPRLIGWLINKDVNQETAADLYHDLFIKIMGLLAAGRYREDGKYLQWVNMVLRNLWIDYVRKETLKKQWFRVQIEDFYYGFDEYYGVSDPALNAEQILIKSEQIDILTRGLNQLKPEQKYVLIQNYFEDITFSTMADQENESINTLLGRARYGRGHLKEYIKKENREKSYERN